MNRISLLVHLCLVGLTTLVSACPVLGEEVDHVYVIRRKLGGGNEPPVNRNIAAHSGLLLHTKDGGFYVLEYMDDGKTYLTKTKQEVVKENKDDKWVHIRALGRLDKSEKELNWTRQLIGSPLKTTHTPEELQTKMQATMKEYNVWKQEYCHTAQERLRKELGLNVD